MADESMSLKGLFQGMVPVGCELVQGTVIQLSPLKIQITNDEKLIVGPAAVCFTYWRCRTVRSTSFWTGCNG